MYQIWGKSVRSTICTKRPMHKFFAKVIKVRLVSYQWNPHLLLNLQPFYSLHYTDFNYVLQGNDFTLSEQNTLTLASAERSSGFIRECETRIALVLSESESKCQHPLTASAIRIMPNTLSFLQLARYQLSVEVHEIHRHRQRRGNMSPLSLCPQKCPCKHFH